MSKSRKRRANLTAEQKIRILRAHLLEDVPISDVGDRSLLRAGRRSAEEPLPRWPASALGASIAVALMVSACGGDATAPSTNEPPTVSFTYTPDPPFAGEAIAFTSTASDPDGTVVNHAWDFGDGSTGTGATLSHAFASAGAYTVSLTVTDDGGATNSATNIVDVAPAPSIAEIAGAWHGGLEEQLGEASVKRAVVSVTVHASLGFDRKIATVRYWFGRPAVICEGAWRVVDAQEGVLEVEEFEEVFGGIREGCPEGNVLLEHDPDARTLRYTKTLARLSGTMDRADSVSFAPIAGAWTGTGIDSDGEFWIEAHLNARAVQGEVVGHVEYGTDDPQLYCQGDWLALEVQGDVFSVSERIVSGVCPHGTVRLEYDAETETLTYDFAHEGDGSADATGALSRG